jgi:hypothetical protein
MSDVASARKVKNELKAQIGQEPWCVGIGVEREDGVGFIVRVSVAPGSGVLARSRVPDRMAEVMIKIVENDG